MEVKHGRGYVYAIEYHLVWCVKYRRSVLTGAVEQAFKEELQEIADSYGFSLEALEVMPDHVHLLVATSPQHFIPRLIKVLKGISARKLFLRHPELKESLWGGHLWNPSYFVATVSEQTESAIQCYIASQKSP